VNSDSDHKSVLGRVEPREWDPDDDAAREAALEDVNQVIGRLSSLLDREQHLGEPGSARMTELRERQAEWAQVAESLHNASRERVEHIRATCSQILRGTT
jgi:hypothetical protein